MKCSNNKILLLALLISVAACPCVGTIKFEVAPQLRLTITVRENHHYETE